MDALSEEINCSRALGRVFDSVLGAILCALDLSSATLRARALRALGQVVADDATVLEQVRLAYTDLYIPLCYHAEALLSSQTSSERFRTI